MAAFEETESVLPRERCPNLLAWGEAESMAEEGLGLPLGLSRFAPRYVTASPDSLAAGLCRRPASMSIFFMTLLWSELAAMLLRVGIVGIVVARD